MEIVEGLAYHPEHFWVEVEEGGLCRVGLTDVGQAVIGEIVEVHLPFEGQDVKADEPCGSLEAEEDVFDIFAPISGTVTEVNEDLTDAPETINESPYTEGWLFAIQPSRPDQVDQLMSAEQYEDFVMSQLSEEDE